MRLTCCVMQSSSASARSAVSCREATAIIFLSVSGGSLKHDGTCLRLQVERKVGAAAIVLVHHHEEGTIAERVKGVAELDGNIGIDDLFWLRRLFLGCGGPDRGNISHEHGGFFDFFEDHPREVWTARNPFAVLV